MAIKRQNSTDVKISLKVSRDSGQTFLRNSDGDEELGDFLVACTITEGIDIPAVYAELIIQDSAGLVNTLTGSETWRLIIETGNSEVGYYFQSYNIDSRARSGNTESFIIEAVSKEFILNEGQSLFGHTDIIFDKKTKAKELVEKIIEDLPSNKNVFAEDSQNSHPLIIPHWRPFDTIFWIAQHSVRATSGGSDPQNGFIFWENRMGYHYKTIDKIIEDVNNQDYDTESNLDNGTARLYRYKYEPKKSGDEDSDDFRIENVTFPEDRNFLLKMRNGSWSGYSMGLDPSKFSNSQVSRETPTAGNAAVYNINEYWNKMSHIQGGKNPVENFTDEMKQVVERPRRIRYNALPNRIFDQKGSTTDNKQYDETPYLQAYQHLRLQSFKNIKLMVNIPGNLDLYAGYGVEIIIPRTKPKNDKIETDETYSGKYVIAGIRHKYANQAIFTEMLLYRDSIPENK